MPQILLRSNRRFGLTAFLLALMVTVLLALLAYGTVQPWLRVLACLGLLILIPVGFLLWRFMQTPRVRLDGDELLLYVRTWGRPFRVPLEVVEVFFMGQGAVTGQEPGHPREYQGHVAANVVVRLADSATEWHRRSVNQWLAVWADGYVTLRGLWCENIDQELLKSMNSQLMQAKRALRKGSQA